jgi:hypothetical protein
MMIDRLNRDVEDLGLRGSGSGFVIPTTIIWVIHSSVQRNNYLRQLVVWCMHDATSNKIQIHIQIHCQNSEFRVHPLLLITMAYAAHIYTYIHIILGALLNANNKPFFIRF